jgi:hypothetical protein
MRFLCLVYFEPETLMALSSAEKAALNRDSLAYNDELSGKSHYITAEALQPVETARTVRVRRGKTAVTDGPFAETKEVVGGFILIEAAGMDGALARHGSDRIVQHESWMIEYFLKLSRRE